MSESFEQQVSASRGCPAPADVALMLRAHAELRCLCREVIPVLRQIETRGELPDEQLGAALAYLEVTWMQARNHARHTDAAYCSLAASAEDDRPDGLSETALRYRTAVRVLRSVLAGRVAALLDGAAVPDRSALPDGSPMPHGSALPDGSPVPGTASHASIA